MKKWKGDEGAHKICPSESWQGTVHKESSMERNFIKKLFMEVWTDFQGTDQEGVSAHRREEAREKGMVLWKLSGCGR